MYKAMRATESAGPGVQRSVCTTTCFCLGLARPLHAGTRNSPVMSTSGAPLLNMKISGCSSFQLARTRGPLQLPAGLHQSPQWCKVSTFCLCIEQVAKHDLLLSMLLSVGQKQMYFVVLNIELLKGDSPDVEPPCQCSQLLFFKALASYFGCMKTQITNRQGWQKTGKKTTGVIIATILPGLSHGIEG